MADHGYPLPEDPERADALVLLDGGHATLLKGVPVQQAAHDIASFIEDHGENALMYFQPDNKPPNSVAIRPSKVVAIVAKIV